MQGRRGRGVGLVAAVMAALASVWAPTQGLAAPGVVVGRVLRAELRGREPRLLVETLAGRGGELPGRLVVRPARGAVPAHLDVGCLVRMVLGRLPATPDAVLPCVQIAVVGRARHGRTLVRGTIAGVELAGGGGPPSLLGLVRLRAGDGTEQAFRVYDATLILIQDVHGGLWVGALRQLRPGWRCSVAYGLAGDDEPEPDARPGGEPEEVCGRTQVTLDADNLVVEAE